MVTMYAIALGFMLILIYGGIAGCVFENILLRMKADALDSRVETFEINIAIFWSVFWPLAWPMSYMFVPSLRSHTRVKKIRSRVTITDRTNTWLDGAIKRYNIKEADQ